jgi:Tfp pilus assembly protein PilN
MKQVRLTLEFAPAALVAVTKGRVALAVGLLLLAAALLQMATAWRARSQEAMLLGAVDTGSADGARAKRAPAKTDAAALAKLRSAQSVARHLTTPWVDLLASLESAPQEAVALMSFEPSAAKQTVRLTAEAKDAKAMLAYLQALQHDARLASVVLTSHQVQAQAPGTPLRFQIQAGWGMAP